MKTNQTKSPLRLLTEKTVGSKELLKNDRKQAGRILKKNGEAAAVEAAAVAFIIAHAREGRQPDFVPPAKCNIIAISRPFAEWGISKLSRAIQEHIYALPSDQVPTTNVIQNKSSQDKWLSETGIDTSEFSNVQAFNLIYVAAINRYHGVVKKVENRNEKKRAKLERKNERRRENGQDDLVFDGEVALDDKGYLLQPPGVNETIQCYNNCSPKPYVVGKHPHIQLPAEYASYNKEPVFKIVSEDIKFPNRLDIPEGQPGYVPEWQRCFLTTNKHKRMRLWYSNQRTKPRTGRRSDCTNPAIAARVAAAKAAGAILFQIRIGDDWMVFDGRGLLRNLRWRDMVNGDLTVSNLLDFFTGDPIIDPKRNLITFSYKQEFGVVSQKIVKGKGMPKLLTQLTEPVDDKKSEVGLTVIDLGQTNPIAAATYRVSHEDIPQDDDFTSKEPLSRFILPNELQIEIARYRQRNDALEASLKKEALLSLTNEQQEEVTNRQSSSITKQTLMHNLGLDPNKVSWDKVNGFSFFISDWLTSNGREQEAYFVSKSKNGTEKRVKKNDFKWAMENRSPISSETVKASGEALWALKRDNEGYIKQSKAKEQLARRIANFVVSETKRITQCSNIVIAIEDLTMKFFYGSGKREDGWDNFFVAKKENRWFIQALHKAFSELAKHRGIYVMEFMPHRTSITCPSCKHVDKDNRDGEKFKCMKCGSTFNADLEVATSNGYQVVMTGKTMPRAIEQAGDAKKAGSAREGKSAKSNNKSKAKKPSGAKEAA